MQQQNNGIRKSGRPTKVLLTDTETSNILDKAKVASQRRKDENDDNSKFTPDNTNETINLYDVFLENYGFIDSYKDDKPTGEKLKEMVEKRWVNIDKITPGNYFLLRQAKWLVCFYILFYIDFLHDFKDRKRTRFDETRENQLELFMSNKLWESFIQLNDFLVENIEYPILKAKSKSENPDFIGYLFQDGSFPEHYDQLGPLDKAVDIDINTELYRYITQDYRTKKNVIKINSSKLSDTLQVHSEYCIAIMGVSKIRLPNIQNTVFNSENSKFHNFLNKYIAFNNRLNPKLSYDDAIKENIHNGNFPYVVGVDAVSSSVKHGPMLSLIHDSIISNQEVDYISSTIDKLDGSSFDNSVKNALKEKNAIVYPNIRLTHFKTNKNIFIYFNFNLHFNLSKSIELINYTITENNNFNFNLNITKFFNIIEKSTLLNNNGGTITLEKVCNEITTSKNLNLSPFKTILDFAQSIEFFLKINKVITPDLHNLFLTFDILSADKASIFIKGVGLEESEPNRRPKLGERGYTYYLRNNKLKEIYYYPNVYVTPYTGVNILKRDEKMKVLNFLNIGAFGKKRVKVKNNVDLIQLNKDIIYLKLK